MHQCIPGSFDRKVGKMAMVSTLMPSESHTAPIAQGSHALPTSTSKKSHETKQEVEPGEEVMLVLQAEHAPSDLAAIAIDHFPAVQSVQALAPLSEYPPALQSEQAVAPMTFVETCLLHMVCSRVRRVAQR